MIDMKDIFERDRLKFEEARRRGERIRPSPEFLGVFVANLRHLARWKQSTLAGFAGVSLSTIERIERGEGASDEALDRVATALGQSPGAFTALRDPVEPSQKAEWIDQFSRLVVVQVKPFRTHAQVRQLALCDLFFIENSRVGEECNDEVDNIKDWLGLTNYCLSPASPVIKDEPVKRRELYEGTLSSVRSLERAGATVLAGIFTHSIGKLGPCSIGAVVVFLKSKDPGAVKRPFLFLDPLEFDSSLKASFSNPP